VFGLNCLSLTPTDVDFITSEGQPAFRTTEKYYDWGVKVEVQDCNGEPMAVIKENLLHSFAHTPRAEYVVELPGEPDAACCFLTALLPFTTFGMYSLCPRLGMGQLAFLQDGLQTLIMPPTAVSQIPDHSEYYTLQHVAYLQLSPPKRLNNPFYFSPQMGLRSLGANRGHSSQTPS